MVHRIGVMIGSPSDADTEREAVTDTILRWNAHSGRSMGVFLEPVRWETHATPGLQGRPQGMINEELIPQSDALVAIFRSRAGSPTGVDVSGTIEEIRECMRLGKYVVVYFYEGEVSIDSVDPDQLTAIRDFKREIQKQGLTGSYKTVNDLRANLPHHLTAIVRKLLPSSASSSVSQEATESHSSASPLPLEPSSQTGRTNTVDGSHLVINDSERWLLLGTHFYQAESIRESADDSLVVTIRSTNAEDDANLSELKPRHFGRSRPIAFAHRSDGFVVTVKSVESVSEGGQKVWTMTLAPENIEYGGSIMDMAYRSGSKKYTPDDFARLRAGRILLNDPPPFNDEDHQGLDRMEQAMIESFIQGSNSPVSVEQCTIQLVHRSVPDNPELFMRLARLTSIYFLKAGNVAERILDLTLGPIRDGKVHVRFRGQRRKVASNVEPAVITIEGDCTLE